MWSDYKKSIINLIEEAELSLSLFDEHETKIKKYWEKGCDVDECFEAVFDRYL